jgi:hypothetical protein
MKPFLLGKNAVDSKLLRVTHGPFAAPVQNGAAAAHVAGPHVETIKQGDKIVRLVVTCSCGERIEVECLYPAGK